MLADVARTMAEVALGRVTAGAFLIREMPSFSGDEQLEATYVLRELQNFLVGEITPVEP